MGLEMQKADSLNCLIGLDFDLLKTNLNAIFNKTDNGYKLLLAPTTLEPTEGVTIGEMMQDFQRAFGLKQDDKTIENSIGALGNSAQGSGGIDITKLSFELNQAFMYISKEGEAAMECEYAFAINVNATDALPDMGFFRIKSLSLAVWNTKRKTVLAKMGMGDFANLLPA